METSSKSKKIGSRLNTDKMASSSKNYLKYSLPTHVEKQANRETIDASIKILEKSVETKNDRK